ncbi:MAG TPA: phosphoribosylformylglycinamidine synthase subunit PurL [Lacipirellulaceae bacterium]|jgi:phosphoribosylformylglycinamidine synthase|nr:phosphoribosylformylglycinamidine synthase subunit PurL [Lacipirellulaceae bacterium]
MLWEINIRPAAGQPDRVAERLATAARDFGLANDLRVVSARGYLVEGDTLSQTMVETLAAELLVDPVVERANVRQVASIAVSTSGISDGATCVTVLLKPGVMDPVAQSALAASSDLNIHPAAIATARKYWLTGASDAEIKALGEKLLANDAIEQVYYGPLELERLELGRPYRFDARRTPIRELDDAGLMRLSREGQLYLQMAEMQTIQKHFRDLDREPTDVELETIAQTWSEHCSHKTLAGRISYADENGERSFENMLKETIFAATTTIRQRLGAEDWCVSVFEDNAGIVRFDDEFNVAFKVETHNHPSALEPYGGANTGMGGVIRDIMGTGMGAKPICSTDVFCFALPDTPAEELPPGTLHPRRVMHGVVEGVRDYGNRMGIPTVNGAVYFDSRYLGNPLVYCGNVGLIPRDKSFKQVQPGDLIVAVGGRTGRDGIHGATFSSAELTSQSEQLSGGAVQIGNAIEEKKVLDVLLVARDRGLFNAVTDCGAGGFSSAVGEMGEKIGAEVHLHQAPLKYEGLSYTEIWISEAQERMVLAVPEKNWKAIEELCRSEGVESTVIGRFVPSGRLHLYYREHCVADLDMQFLHKGRPPVVRKATYAARQSRPLNLPDKENYTEDLLRILASPNVASKEWIVRQYDHEVQGGSVIKPFVGVANDGPSDAAVLRPVLGSRRGIVIGCGMNPRFGDFDPYHMAASAIDEAVRNCVAVGANPARIAILDNFCWGDCERAETLGGLVRAALACHDVSIALGTPFISGKDSLNNEFSYQTSDGKRQTIAIPPSLLISAIGQIDDVARCVTMDFKQAGNVIYIVGETRNELGGSHFALVNNLTGGTVPTVDPQRARRTFAAVHQAIASGLVRACHDLSEGGLAAGLAEMAFAGGLGARVAAERMPRAADLNHSAAILFSESNTRFICEVEPASVKRFEACFEDPTVCQSIGSVQSNTTLEIGINDRPAIAADIAELKRAWKTLLHA